MKIKHVVLVAALAVAATTAFAGGEAPTKVYAIEAPAPAPKGILARVWDGTVKYTKNRVGDVVDLSYQTYDAAAGVIGLDPAGNDRVK